MVWTCCEWFNLSATQALYSLVYVIAMVKNEVVYILIVTVAYFNSVSSCLKYLMCFSGDFKNWGSCQNILAK